MPGAGVKDNELPRREDKISNRFTSLFETLSAAVESEYQEARTHAREHDPQRAGHEGEATWRRLIEDWGPNWPVVTRKYIVGPGGESNEIDVLLLKPDYPNHLRTQASILISGVAAAFSSKLTLRKQHLKEVVNEKKQLLVVADYPNTTVREALTGPFPFGLLAHSSELFEDSVDFAGSMQDLYEEIAHDSERQLVSAPSEELDALLVADQGFLSTTRISLAPDPRALKERWKPVSSFHRYGDNRSRSGAPLAQFITWLNSKCSTSNDASLKALEGFFGADSSSGYMTHWPIDIYPEHIRNNRQQLLDKNGSPLLV